MRILLRQADFIKKIIQPNYSRKSEYLDVIETILIKVKYLTKGI